ncbi:MAG: Uncharacterized protein JWR30_3751 [Conexibacter sp.]|nr:Uncharacterized protein [Conexibacter sp.]
MTVLVCAGCGASKSAVTQPPLPPAYPVATATDAQAQAPEDSAPPVDTAQQSPPTPAAPKPRASRHILSSADQSSFLALQRSLGGRIGLAVSGLGIGQTVQVVGGLREGVAWSTSKVPVAMAVYEAGLASAQQANLKAAITASDNAAAERLWASLGGGQQAASAADAQLRAAGDQRTRTESRQLRSGFTPFGQTSWALTDQVRFTAGMACSQAGSQVLGLMNQTVAGQRWGLGAAGVEAQLKGGWGPGTRPGAGGGYLDRQMGVMTIRGKPMAITIAAAPTNGSHDTGVAELTSMARWAASHVNVSRLPSRPRCN